MGDSRLRRGIKRPFVSALSSPRLFFLITMAAFVLAVAPVLSTVWERAVYVSASGCPLDESCSVCGSSELWAGSVGDRWYCRKHHPYRRR